MMLRLFRNAAALGVIALGGTALAWQETPKTEIQIKETTIRSGTEDDFVMARRWQKADDLIGKKVVSSANEDLGKIEDIVVDANSGRILYGVLSFGGFMGVGDKLFAIPWRSLSLGGDAKAFTLNVEKDRLKNAPGFDKKQWPNFADEKWATSTYEYYKQVPYWRSDAKPEGDMSRVSYRDRWTYHPVLWQKASDLTGKDIHNHKNEDLGRISDLIIDPDHGRVMYGVLSFRARMFAIPWNALTLSGDAKKFVVNIDKEALTDAISFTKDSWPNFTDTGWATETHRVYKVEPYWVEVRERRIETP